VEDRQLVLDLEGAELQVVRAVTIDADDGGEEVEDRPGVELIGALVGFCGHRLFPALLCSGRLSGCR